MKERLHKILRPSNLLAVYGAALFLLFLWDSGFDAAHHHYFQAIFDVVLALFGLGMVSFMILDRQLDKAHEEMDKAFEGLLDGLKDVIESIEKDSHTKQAGEDAARAVLDPKGENYKPTEADCRKIEQIFHDKTGKYMKATPNKNGKLDAEVQDKPFPHSKSEARRMAAMDGVKPTKSTKKG